MKYMKKQTCGRCSAGLTMLILGSCASLTAASAPDGAAIALTAGDYARAERFLPWNKGIYVTNDDIQHRWIGNEDRFWYLRTDAAGDKKFIMVDAASGRKTPAFDQEKIAAALSKSTGHGVEPYRLPFSIFRYTPNKTAIQFQADGSLWTCQLGAKTCTGGPPPAPKSRETVSPDGRWVVFIRDFNLWARTNDGGASFPLTTDGIDHYGYAGPAGTVPRASDSTYESGAIPPQVLWSPDSRYVLTHRLDERKVKELFMVQSTPEDGSVRPKLYTFRFAMPGDENVFQLEPVVIDVATRRQVNLVTPPLVSSTKTLIETRDTWWSADSRKIYYLNRDRFSKVLSFNSADPATGAVKEVIRDTSDTVAQSNANNPWDYPAVRTLENGDVIWYSQRDGWGHLYYYDAAGALRNQITRGDWLVRNIVRLDSAEKRIYFTASGREDGRDAYEQRLYSVRFDGTGMRLLTPEEAEHDFSPASSLPGAQLDTLSTEAQKGRFSPSGRYFVDSHSRPDQPSVLTLRAADGRLIKRLEEADISRLRAGGYTPVEPFKTLAADGITAIYGNLFRPSTFDPGRKYPVIDAIYAGPQVIRTKKTFGGAVFDFFQAQSLAELGFIVVTMDGRGTPLRSKAFMDYAHGRWGRTSELEDHIAGIRQLAQRYSYMDLDRVGIDGVSLGGSAAVRALSVYPDFFKVGVSALGTHDLRAVHAHFGDTFGGPAETSDHSASSTPQLAANLRGKLLLMHGEMDDNVSSTQTMKLVDALIKANKDFDLFFVPNGGHGAFATSTYYIRRKWDYFVRNLAGLEPPAGYAVAAPR